MSNITEQIYIQKIDQSPDFVQEYILHIRTNNSFVLYFEKYRPQIKDRKDKIDFLRHETSLLLLQLISVDDFFDFLIELLEIQESEVEDMTNDFFSICLPPQIQDFLEKRLASDEINTNKKYLPVENKIEEAKLTDAEHISHHDLLSEIENPTPSISTTADFQNQNFVKSSQPQANTPVVKTSANKGINTAVITTPDGTIHSSATTNTYTNPALNIATKLDQKLSTPSASIPKDIYVSKKPDPYHEPVDL